MSLGRSRDPVDPRAALGSPVWWGALALLVLNDHVLKGADLLPGALTGKLSDVAGLVVAPVLLATLLGLRTRRGVALSHIAVGLGFGLLQLPAVAIAVEATTAALGLPWRVTPDPTDLLALVALGLSWSCFGGSSAGERAPARRLTPVHAVASGLGLLACVATSYDEGFYACEDEEVQVTVGLEDNYDQGPGDPYTGAALLDATEGTFSGTLNWRAVSGDVVYDPGAAAETTELNVEIARVEDDEAYYFDGCSGDDARLYVDVAIQLSTTDGLLAESFSTRLFGVPGDTTMYETLPTGSLVGALQDEPAAPDTALILSFDVEVRVEEGELSGRLWATIDPDPNGPDPIQTVEIAAW